MAPTNNPQGPATSTWRVVRGGAWVDNDDLVRAAYRDNCGPDYWGCGSGFRCVRSQ